MSDIRQAREALVRRVLEGSGKASTSERQAAFDHNGPAGDPGTLVDRVATNAHRISDRDVDAAIASGLSEDQVFEIVVCAAIGAASRQLDTALASLETATRRE